MLLSLALSAAGCGIEPVDFGDKRCPCASGWSCDDAADRCCQPDVVVDDFRASWRTANTIRWQWVPRGDRARFVRYEVHLATRPADLGTDAAVVFGPDDNPELGGFVLQRTGGADDLVTHTTTGGLEPSTAYVAQLVVVDAGSCPFRSDVAAASTSLDPPEEIVIFRDDPPPGSAMPPAFLPVADATGGGRHLEHRPDEDPECIMSGEGVCSQNLRYRDMGLDLSDISQGELANTAFFEVSVASDAAVPSFFSRVWLSFDDCTHIYRIEPFTIPADGEFRVLQYPLQELRDERGVALTREVLDSSAGGSLLCEFCVGGIWGRRTTGGAPARVRVDEVRVRY